MEELNKDVTELAHLLHITKRPTLNEFIQMAIDLLLAKIESLKDKVSEYFETDLSWAKVVARQHKKRTCIEQRVTHPIPVISDCYNLLRNGMNGKKKTPKQCKKVKVFKFQIRK
jgi:hypothetical protein